MQATTVQPVSDGYAQLLGAAFSVLDRYATAIADRDSSKSLNEDRCELMRRVRAALASLILDEPLRRDDVAEIAQRIDGWLADECSAAQPPIRRMGSAD